MRHNTRDTVPLTILSVQTPRPSCIGSLLCCLSSKIAKAKIWLNSPLALFRNSFVTCALQQSPINGYATPDSESAPDTAITPPTTPCRQKNNPKGPLEDLLYELLTTLATLVKDSLVRRLQILDSDAMNADSASQIVSNW
jgi:hypothetical protein